MCSESCPLATVPQKRYTFLQEPCVKGGEPRAAKRSTLAPLAQGRREKRKASPWGEAPPKAVMRGTAKEQSLCLTPHPSLRDTCLGGARSDAASGHGFCPQWQKPQFAAFLTAPPRAENFLKKGCGMICTPKVGQTFGGAYFYGKKRKQAEKV